MVDGTRAGFGDVSTVVEACCALIVERRVSPAQAQRVVRLLVDFALFVRVVAGTEVELVEVGAGTVERFVEAAHPDGRVPSLAEMHHRRSSIRLLFRLARELGVDAGDPTLDLVLPPRCQRGVRALTDEEVALCRSHAFWSLTDARRAAAWALGEATCRSAEIATATVGDVDLDGGRVWIHGGRVTADRWGDLSEWGAIQLARRVEQLDGDPTRPLVYAGRAGADSGQVSTCLAIVDVFTRAGLAGERDLRPGSIAAWAGRRILEETGRIDVTAKRLGMASLDRAARFIGWDWDEEPEAA